MSRLVAAIFAAVVFFTGRVVFAWGIGIPVAVIGLALLIDFLVLTDRERVENVIADGAAAVNRNDVEAVLKLVSPQAAELQAGARRTMEIVKFKDVRVTTTPRIIINPLKSPKEAVATFTATADVKVTTGEAGKYPQRVEVHFQWFDDRWLATDAKWRPIIGPDEDEHGAP